MTLRPPFLARPKVVIISQCTLTHVDPMQSTRAPSEPSSSSSSSSSLTQPPCQPHRRVLSCQSPQSQSPQSPLSPSPSLVRKQQQPPPPPPPHRCFRRLHLQTTVTPWIDPIEFERVGRALLQAQYLPVGRRQLTRHHHPHHHHECPPAPVASTTFTAALERVAIWRLRSGGGADHLPHAIESTASLALLLWRDYNQQQQPQPPSQPHEASSSLLLLFPCTTTTTTEFSLAYSAAIIRTINGLADRLQQQRSVASSVLHLSQQLGIPDWLVDIRHGATHNQLSSLPVLRLAAQTLLQYWQAVYWEPCFAHARAFYDIAQERFEHYRKVALVELLERNNTTGQRNRKVKEGMRMDGGEEWKSHNNNSGSSRSRSRSKALEQQEQDDDDDDNDDQEDAGPVQKALPSGSYVGTNFNRFAVLQDTSKRKKKKDDKDREGNQTSHSDATTAPNVDTVSPKPPEPKRRKRSKRNEIPSNPTPTWWAQAFVKTNLPLNIAWDAALCFLVQLVDNHSSGSRTVVIGALVPPVGAMDQEEDEETSNFADSQKCYQPLLTILVREWPGFLSSLVVRLVDTVIRLEEEECSGQGDSLAPPNHQYAAALCRRQLVYLCSWVEYLLSRSFLLSTGTDGKQSKSSQLDLLRVRQVPLGGLLDRCETLVASNPPSVSFSLPAATSASSLLAVSQNSCKRLARVFREILEQGVESVPRPVLDRREQDSETVNQPFDAATTEKPSGFFASLAANAETKPSGFPSGKLSLDELETLLNIDQSEHMKAPTTQGANVEAADKEMQAANSETNTEPRWVLCDTWEPCAIGTLPGYPLMQISI